MAADYGDYELVDIGDERWRLRFGQPVAYFRYLRDKRDPRYPWEQIWMRDDYYG